MTQLQTSPKSPSLIKQFANFTDSTIGLEKTLRLIQALAQLVAEITTDHVLATRCLIAKSQLALSRRYFRFFAFIPCFERVLAILGGDFSSGWILSMIQLAKFSALGVYLVLEDLTILHGMNVWLVPWNTPVLIEANKFWFYAISLSIFGAVVEIVVSLFPGSKAQEGEGKATQQNGSAKENMDEISARQSQKQRSIEPLVKSVVVDGCDLLLPGTFLGWMEASEAMIGVTMVLSTLVSGGDVWDRAQ